MNIPKSGQILVVILLSLYWLPLTFQIFLKYRNISAMFDIVLIPKILRNHYTERLFKNSRYNQFCTDKNLVPLLTNFYYAVVVSAIIIGGLMPILWKHSMKLAAYLELKGEPNQSLAMMLAVATVYALLEIPTILFRSLVEISFKAMCLELIELFFFYIVLLIVAVIATPAVYFLTEKGLGSFLLIVLGFVLSSWFMYDRIIYDYEATRRETHFELKDVQLRNEIIKLGEQVGVQTDRIFVSKKNFIGAYYTGYFGNGRILINPPLLHCAAFCKDGTVLCDTKKPVSTSPCPNQNQTDAKPGQVMKRYYANEQILGIIGHEFGHWKHGHTFWDVILRSMWLILIWSIGSLLYGRGYIFQAFCFYSVQPLVVGILLVFTFYYLPIDKFIWPMVQTYITHCQEYTADYFGSKTGYRAGLVESLLKLNADFNIFPMGDTLYSMFRRTHPTVYERIVAIQGNEI